eukprot:gene5991-biopygen13484
MPSGEGSCSLTETPSEFWCGCSMPSGREAVPSPKLPRSFGVGAACPRGGKLFPHRNSLGGGLVWSFGVGSACPREGKLRDLRLAQARHPIPAAPAVREDLQEGEERRHLDVQQRVDRRPPSREGVDAVARRVLRVDDPDAGHLGEERDPAHRVLRPAPQLPPPCVEEGPVPVPPVLGGEGDVAALARRRELVVEVAVDVEGREQIDHVALRAHHVLVDAVAVLGTVRYLDVLQLGLRGEEEEPPPPELGLLVAPRLAREPSAAVAVDGALVAVALRLLLLLHLLRAILCLVLFVLRRSSAEGAALVARRLLPLLAGERADHPLEDALRGCGVESENSTALVRVALVSLRRDGQLVERHDVRGDRGQPLQRSGAALGVQAVVEERRGFLDELEHPWRHDVQRLAFGRDRRGRVLPVEPEGDAAARRGGLEAVHVPPLLGVLDGVDVPRLGVAQPRRELLHQPAPPGVREGKDLGRRLLDRGGHGDEWRLHRLHLDADVGGQLRVHCVDEIFHTRRRQASVPGTRQPDGPGWSPAEGDDDGTMVRVVFGSPEYSFPYKNVVTTSDPWMAIDRSGAIQGFDVVTTFLHGNEYSGQGRLRIPRIFISIQKRRDHIQSLHGNRPKVVFGSPKYPFLYKNVVTTSNPWMAIDRSGAIQGFDVVTTFLHGNEYSGQGRLRIPRIFISIQKRRCHIESLDGNRP